MTGDLQAGKAKLGPFDGRVAAFAEESGAHFFITSNAQYIPDVGPGLPDRLFLRRDMRYGPDDPTLWPQQYNELYCHLGAIPRMPSQQADIQGIGIMWWNPDHVDFVCPQSGLTITRGLGKLSRSKCFQLDTLVAPLLEQYKTYAQSIVPPAKILRLVPELAQAIKLGMERLKTIPSTYDRMVLGVTGLQRCYLELTGLLRHLTVYQPRMEDPDAEPREPDDCVGVFTADPRIAQRFYIAGLPYWFIRPLTAFNHENILRVVTPLDPTVFLELEAARGYPSVPVGTDHTQRLSSLRLCTQNVPWYRNPFAPSQPAPIELSTLPIAGPRRIPVQPSAHGHQHKPRTHNASSPCRFPPLGDAAAALKHMNAARVASRPNPNAQIERDKYTILDAKEMPPAIFSWAGALPQVDRSHPPLYCAETKALYVFPEPALLVSSPDESRRQLLLYNYQLMRDALLYRLGDPTDPHHPLSAQTWRDILQGKVTKQGRPGSMAESRTMDIEAVLGPAMDSCGIGKEELIKFSSDLTQIPRTTINRAREMLWEIAEMNFRHELLALDQRASGLDRPEACKECFPGQTLIGMDISESKQGFAAEDPMEQLPYLLRLTGLMCDWRHLPRSGAISEAALRLEWSSSQVCQLEGAVAKYYTTCFYEYFGRPAVIPMRLNHEFGT
ncbi:hypothetical protein B0H19DRAFT_1055696 [Mycena capillaripes]|nr:hypothetical protein B0H19DRAFT_1055696 [Mycena capillaripes]